MRRVLGLVAGALVAACAAAPAKDAPPAADAVRLVQSAPVETDLADPDLPRAKDVWIEMARGAKRSIDLAQFYVANEPGSDLDPVIAEIEAAAARGVGVRLIVSNKLAGQDPKTLARFRAMKGAEVRVWDLAKLTGGIIHAKYWIVDGREVFLGSQNFDWRALAHIHEMGARVRDEAVARDLGRVFAVDWAAAGTGEAPPRPRAGNGARGAGPLELVASPPELNPPGVRPALEALLELIAGARRSLRIQLLDYSPVALRGGFWPDIDNALRAAAVRGVKVEMLVSHWSTHAPAIDHLKSIDVLPNVEVRIVTVPEHSGGFIPYARVVHAKYMVADGETLWIGTSNWAPDYFLKSRNVELIARVPDLAAQAERVFRRLWDGPHAAPLDWAKRYEPPRKG